MDKKPIQTAATRAAYNANGDLMLHKSSDGTINDSPWHSSIRDVLLISFAKQTFFFDLQEEFFPPADIDPDAWLYPPVDADPTATELKLPMSVSSKIVNVSTEKSKTSKNRLRNV